MAASLFLGVFSRSKQFINARVHVCPHPPHTEKKIKRKSNLLRNYEVGTHNIYSRGKARCLAWRSGGPIFKLLCARYSAHPDKTKIKRGAISHYRGRSQRPASVVLFSVYLDPGPVIYVYLTDDARRPQRWNAPFLSAMNSAAHSRYFMPHYSEISVLAQYYAQE